MIEVRAQDAPGLLHRIGRALEQRAVRVRSAHVSTLGANAVDAFYVTGTDGAPLPAEQAAAVAAQVETALELSPAPRPPRATARRAARRARHAGEGFVFAGAGYPGERLTSTPPTLRTDERRVRYSLRPP